MAPAQQPSRGGGRSPTRMAEQIVSLHQEELRRRLALRHGGDCSANWRRLIDGVGSLRRMGAAPANHYAASWLIRAQTARLSISHNVEAPSGGISNDASEGLLRSSSPVRSCGCCLILLRRDRLSSERAAEPTAGGLVSRQTREASHIEPLRAPPPPSLMGRTPCGSFGERTGPRWT